MRPPEAHVVIVGGGLAGQRCAEALRKGGHTGAITMVCREPVAPYDRPPLSKAFLAGDLTADQLALRDSGWHAGSDVTLVLGDAATGVDALGRRVRLDSGETVGYDRLVLATGSRPRALPGTEELANVHALRTLDDAERLRSALAPGVRLVVLGAGLIGQEVAATARKLGAEVTLVEAAPMPLGRALHPDLAGWLVEMQRAEGVEVLLGAGVAELATTGDRLDALLLTDGTRVELDLLLVAIGVAPEVEWLGAPLDTLLARPEIHAAGDLAGGDHWEAAAHQGRAVARAILGDAPAAPPVTSWWSDVHGVRLQGLGSPAGADALIVDGDRDARSFTAVALRGGDPVAALAVGRPRELPRLRRLLTSDPDPTKEAA
jgi:3-phenylpropionate/trans-cinnamate dioxygenase ferredoxin reductase subunit